MPGFARTAIVGVAAFLAWLAPRAAHAQSSDGDLKLTWVAPAGCPVGEDVRSAALRGVDRARMLPGTLVAEATVDSVTAGGPPTWRVRLRTRRGDTTGERVIEGPTCSGVADATAVVLSLALVPPDTIEAPPPAPAPASPPPPVAPPPPPKPAATEKNPGRHHVAVGVEAAGVLGALPKFAGGGAVDLALTLGSLRVEAEGRLVGSQRATVSGKTSGADFALASVGGRACWAILRGTDLELAPCLGMSVETMSADGVRTDVKRSQSTAWASFAGGVLGRYFLTNWLAVRARAEAVVPLARPRFVVQDVLTTDTVFQPPTLGAAGYFGAEVLFL